MCLQKDQSICCPLPSPLALLPAPLAKTLWPPPLWSFVEEAAHTEQLTPTRMQAPEFEISFTRILKISTPWRIFFGIASGLGGVSGIGYDRERRRWARHVDSLLEFVRWARQSDKVLLFLLLLLLPDLEMFD